ncbi:MAG: YbaB/EbfC family DNA-binding protein [Mycobacteriaceae bacterium]|nr:YbaB/EbfC family DNA-binding protein [Mycobacteriaceae bacterium]
MDDLEFETWRRLYAVLELQDNIAAIRVRESSTDGAVSVEVDGAGAPQVISFTRTVSTMAPCEVEQLVAASTDRAARRALAERGGLVADFNEQFAPHTVVL